MAQKLKDIYDAIDHGSYKDASKLCTAFLKKQPNSALGKALHAVALERCGRPIEALQLCDEAQTSDSVDDQVFSALVVVYRRCQQPARITKMYDVACQREPENKEYAVALFFAAARDSDFAKAQQVAQKLYNKTKEKRYMHWAVVSILLQAQQPEKAKLLDLAMMMLQKAPLDEASPGRASYNRGGQYFMLLLHLMALQLKGSHEQALELLEAQKHLVALPGDLTHMRVHLLTEAGKPREAIKEARRSVLLDAGGNWSTVQELIYLASQCSLSDGEEAALPRHRCVGLAAGQDFELPDHVARLRQKGDGRSSVPDATLAESATFEELEKLFSDDELQNTHLFFRWLRQRDDARAESRLTLELAELELRRIAFCANEAAAARLAAEAGITVKAFPQNVAAWRCAVAEDDLQEFKGLIGDYLGRYGTSRICSYFDLKPYLSLLEGSELEALLQGFEAPAGEQSEASPESGKVARCALATRLRLQRGLRRLAPALPRGQEPPLAELQSEVSGLLKQWASLPVAGRVDELLLFATVGLLDMDRLQCEQLQAAGQPCGLWQQRPHMLDALALAQAAFAQVPQCAHFKVLLVLMYGMLGLPQAMARWYGALEVKNIQHESIAFLAFDAWTLHGSHDGLGSLCKALLQFREDFEKETNDALGVAFHHGVFHRIFEFVEALEGLGRSLYAGRLVVEQVLCDVGQANTYEMLPDCFRRHESALARVAGRPLGDWARRNQDRCLVQGLHPLPLCTPLGTAMSSSSSWRGGTAVPTTLARSSCQVASNSAASIWRSTRPEESPAKTLQPASKRTRPSAAEELLMVGLRRTPARLRSTAAMLQAAAALLRRDDAALADAVTAAREALAADDIGTTLSVDELPAATAIASGTSAASQDSNNDAAPAAAASTAAAEREHHLALPWCIVPPRFDELVRQCSFASCEGAHHTVRALEGAADGWEVAERRFSWAAMAVKACRDLLLAASFAPAAHGPPMLWTFLHESASVVLPVVLASTGLLPKAGAGKKKEAAGQEALYATRVAVKNLLSAMAGLFNDVQGGLETPAPTAATAAALSLPEEAAAALESLAGARAEVLNTIADGHKKQLQALRDALVCRLALVKTKSAFKP